MGGWKLIGSKIQRGENISRFYENERHDLSRLLCVAQRRELKALNEEIPKTPKTDFPCNPNLNLIIREKKGSCQELSGVDVCAKDTHSDKITMEAAVLPVFPGFYDFSKISATVLRR